MWHRFKTFLDESRQEFKRVNWPTRKETTRMVGIVIGLSLGVAVVLGGADLLFGYGLEKLIGL